MKKRKTKRKSVLTPEQRILNDIWRECPGAKKMEASLTTWEGLAAKIAVARAKGTYVVFVTMNPDILETREILKSKFNCEVLTPTEARFGADSIERF